MFAKRAQRSFAIVALLSLAGCATTERAGLASERQTRSVLVGLVNKQQIFDADSRWQPAYERAVIDPESTRALSAVAAGARVDIFLGTWCGDSVREVGRVLRYVDAMGTVPFELRLIAVDRSKSAPGFSEGMGLRFVPTFVVYREGREVGRIIESPPTEIGRDLAGLLNGTVTGEISGRAL